jgi:ParE toxin of type II toxin-antitoxin system, parDE
MDVIRTLKWTSTALKQRNSIFEYWNTRNKSNLYSKKLNLKIKERTTLLKSFPELGTETTFEKTRVLYLSYYGILYQFTDNLIIVTGFWDNRQEPKKLLEFLKNS